MRVRQNIKQSLNKLLILKREIKTRTTNSNTIFCVCKPQLAATNVAVTQESVVYLTFYLFLTGLKKILICVYLFVIIGH